MRGAWHIRGATIADASRLAMMATQLGYATAPEEVEARLPLVMGAADADLLVAADADDVAVGWLHVELKPSLLSPLAAQVMALVVDEEWRGGGVGAHLMEAAEAWAREHGCEEMLVSTRITRERAHGFYRRQGYELRKTNHWFSKPLG